MKMRLSNFLIIGIGALLLGIATWRMGQAYLYLLHGNAAGGQQVKNANSTAGSGSVLILPQIQFWTAQTGVFNSERNAQEEKSRLAALGYEAEIFASDPWKVGIGLAGSQEELAVLRGKLSGAGVPTLVKQVVLEGKSFKISGNEAKSMSEILKNVNNLIRSTDSSAALKPDQLNLSSQYEEVKEMGRVLTAIAATSDQAKNQQLKLQLFGDYQALISKLSQNSSN